MADNNGARNLESKDFTTEELNNIDQFFQDDDSLLPHNTLHPSHRFLHDSEHLLPHHYLFESLPGISRYNTPMNNNTFNNLHGVNSNPRTNLSLEEAFNGLNISYDPPQLAYEDWTQWGSFINYDSAESSNNTSHRPLTTPRLPYDDYNLQRIRANFAARNDMGTFVPKNSLRSLAHREDVFPAINNRGYMNQMDDFYKSNYGATMNNFQNPRPSFVPRYSRSNGFRSNRGFTNQSSPSQSNRGDNDRYRASGIGSSSPSGSSSSWHNSNGARNRFSFTSLNELKGSIRVVAKDRDGCRFLKLKIEEGNSADFHTIFLELKDHICELMMNPFATNLVKTFVEACDEEKINHLIAVVVADELRLEEICVDCQGSRAMQKLIEHVTSSNQRHQLVSALARVAVTLLKSSNGQQVIKQCFACFSNKDVEQILDSVSNHCFEIAIDVSGCCVLQSCIIPASILGSKEHIVGELISNSRFLSENDYGNYVVQFILCLNIQRMTSEILRELSGSYVSLSMNKYGSHVVEKCLEHSSYDQRVGIVNEIIASSMFVEFLQDPYGNYVAQKIMFFAKGNIFKVFVNHILDNYASLHSHLHGKKVLERAFHLLRFS